MSGSLSRREFVGIASALYARVALRGNVVSGSSVPFTYDDPFRHANPELYGAMLSRATFPATPVAAQLRVQGWRLMVGIHEIAENNRGIFGAATARRQARALVTQLEAYDPAGFDALSSVLETAPWQNNPSLSVLATSSGALMDIGGPLLAVLGPEGVALAVAGTMLTKNLPFLVSTNAEIAHANLEEPDYVELQRLDTAVLRQFTRLYEEDRLFRSLIDSDRQGVSVTPSLWIALSPSANGPLRRAGKASWCATSTATRPAS